MSYVDRRAERTINSRHTALVLCLVISILLSGVSAVLSGIMEYRYQRMMNQLERSTQEIRGLMK